MSKCKIIQANDVYKLQYEINNFIEDKQVLSTSMAIRSFNFESDHFYACIIYEEWSEV